MESSTAVLALASTLMRPLCGREPKLSPMLLLYMVMLPQPQRVRKTSDFGTEWAANFHSKESAGCCLAYVTVFGTAKPNRPQPKMCATSKLDLGLVGRERNGVLDSRPSLS